MPTIKAKPGGVRTYAGYDKAISREKRRKIKAYQEVFLTEKELTTLQSSTYTIVKEKSSPKPEPVADTPPKAEVKDKDTFTQKN